MQIGLVRWLRLRLLSIFVGCQLQHSCAPLSGMGRTLLPAKATGHMDVRGARGWTVYLFRILLCSQSRIKRNCRPAGMFSAELLWSLKDGALG